MSKKKHRGKSRKERRERPRRNAQTILSIVATDSTFDFHTDKVSPGRGVWVGKCIHCGCKLGVSERGETDATIEHLIPLCAGGAPSDPRNLALACSSCNSEKGIRHDQHVGKGGRADEVITALQGKRLARWRSPVIDI